MGGIENVKHIMVECPAYEAEQDWAISRYKIVMGEEKFQEVVERDDRGLSYLLGFDLDVQTLVVEISKVYLSLIWNRRTKLLEERRMRIPQGIQDEGD